MDSIVNTFSHEMEYGGPHVHFLAFLLFILIGIIILHGVFRVVIEVLSRVTKVSRDSCAISSASCRPCWASS
ncbi:hypothetical protein [Megasphaera sp.]|uniref:hypothetical protein n=1 Tax=Megasphaera sp. TaxID=2023260 RepID=UPI00307E3C2C